jgi:hypothetical protein
MPEKIVDPRERFLDWDEATKRDAEGHQSKMWTALPVIIKKHDTDKNTVHAQSSIKLKRIKPDGKEEWVEIPKMEDMPILYPGGGGATITMPMAEGDEALAIFSSRSIDKWWQQGGVQEQTEARMHDLSDGFIIPGFRSQPRKLKNVSSTTWQLRTDEENPDHVVDFDPKNKKFTITSPNPVTINAPELRCSGEIIAKYGSDNIRQTTHTHAQDPDSHGDTEQETHKPTTGS